MANSLFKVIIFDLDGTLVDSGGDIVHSINLTLDIFYLNHIERRVCVNFIGNGIRTLVKRFFYWILYRNPDTEIDRKLLESADREYRKIYARHLLDTTVLYPNVQSTLEKLSDYSLAVVSNKAYVYTEIILDHFHIKRYFDLILGGDSVIRKKPHPEPLLRVAKHFNSSPEQCLMVGDSEKDIAAAKSAEVPVAAVTYGMRPKILLEKLKPDMIIDNFEDLLTII